MINIFCPLCTEIVPTENQSEEGCPICRYSHRALGVVEKVWVSKNIRPVYSKVVVQVVKERDEQNDLFGVAICDLSNNRLDFTKYSNNKQEITDYIDSYMTVFKDYELEEIDPNIISDEYLIKNIK